VANKVHSLNLITRSHIYELRETPSNQQKASKLLDRVRESIQISNKNFELFIACLKTIKAHEALANEISAAHRLQLVFRSMTKLSRSDLNLTLFCNSLNDQKLIPDQVKMEALGTQSSREFFSLIYTHLQSVGLGADLLDFLDDIEQTKGLRSSLEASTAPPRESELTIADLPEIQVLPSFRSRLSDNEDVQKDEITEPAKKREESPELDSEKFMSAESSPRDRLSVDDFQDSLTHNLIATRDEGTTGYPRQNLRQKELGYVLSVHSSEVVQSRNEQQVHWYLAYAMPGRLLYRGQQVHLLIFFSSTLEVCLLTCVIFGTFIAS